MNDNMLFLSNSIDDSDNDIIGFSTYVNKLNNAIDKGAQMIAVTSPFGSGKTSIIELLKKCRSKEKNERFLYVQMWSELDKCELSNNACELHKNFLYQIGSAISPRKGTYINRRLSNNYGLLKLHINRLPYIILLFFTILTACLGLLTKQYSDIVLKLLPCLTDTINQVPPILFLLAIILLIVTIMGAEIIFSSKNSESNRVVEADEIIDLYRNEIIKKKGKFISLLCRILKRIPLIKRIPILEGKKYIVIIEDLDRTNDSSAVIHFLKELRKYYLPEINKKSRQNKVIFIVNIKPESIVFEELNEKAEKHKASQTNSLPAETNVNDNDIDKLTKKSEEPVLYAKLFDYILTLQTINIIDYDTILCGLLKEYEGYLEKHALKSKTKKLSDIPGMQWIIRGKHLDIREIKNRLNIATVIFESLKERFPLKQDGIKFSKCAAAAYLTTEFELEFSLTPDDAFEKLIELYLQKKLDAQTAKKILSTKNHEYVKAVIDLIDAELITENYRMYFYNYPKNSIIYGNDETLIQKAILQGTMCADLESVAQRVVSSNSDVIQKSLKKIRQLGLPLPRPVIKNETLFLAALTYDYQFVLEMFEKMNDTEEFLDKNIADIIEIMKFDINRNVYTAKIIADFCHVWERTLSEDHLIKLREALCLEFKNEIQLYEQLFFGEHSIISIKEMDSLEFSDALYLLNTNSKNFSISHIKFIINKFKEQSNVSQNISDKVCEILIIACSTFNAKDIVDYITDYMLITRKLIAPLEEIIWMLLKEEITDSGDGDDENCISNERRNEIFQNYKKIINSVPLTELSEEVLEHINDFDDFDEPYGYSSDIANLLFDKNYYLMSVLVKLHNNENIDFSNDNIINGIKDHLAWAKEHLPAFLRIRKQILLQAKNIDDYMFCFASEMPIPSEDEFFLLAYNKNINLVNILDFFPPENIKEETVKYITRYFNKKYINNNIAYDILKSLTKYDAEIIKLFFENINFSKSFLYFTFSQSKKNSIKRTFMEPLKLDTFDGQLQFMEYTKFLEEDFEAQLLGNTDKEMEKRYINLARKKKGPTNISSATIELLKSFSSYYAFSKSSGINEKLFEEKEYKYYVVSTTLNAKSFIMEKGDRLELLWPTYIEIFSNPSNLSQTVGYMKANMEFLEEIMKSGIYIGFKENALELLSVIKQDAKLISHVFNHESSFVIKYLSTMKSGFVDYEAAKTFIDLISLNSNKIILRNDDVRNNLYEKLRAPSLKSKYTKLRKACGYNY